MVDDDERLAASLRRALAYEGHSVEVAADGPGALVAARDRAPDLVVLDVMLPGLDGVDDRVKGLDAGADDYLAKPFAYDELLARVRALLRRREPDGYDLMRCADLVMDVSAHEVRRGDRLIELTALQFNVLEHFLRHQRQVIEREQLLESVWGVDSEAISNVVDVTIADLRARLETESRPRLLQTVRGVGYVLREP